MSFSNESKAEPYKEKLKQSLIKKNNIKLREKINWE